MGTTTTTSGQARVTVLDDVRLVVGGEERTPRRAKERDLLVLLALRRGRPVATERLIDDLWPDGPPATARAALQSYVANLRRAFGDGAADLATVAGGYQLATCERRSDLLALEREIAAAERGDAAARDAVRSRGRPELAPTVQLPAVEHERVALDRRVAALATDAAQTAPQGVSSAATSLPLVPDVAVPVPVLVAALGIPEADVRSRLRGERDALRTRRAGVEVWRRAPGASEPGDGARRLLLDGLVRAAEADASALLGPAAPEAARRLAVLHPTVLVTLPELSGSAALRLLAAVGRAWQLFDLTLHHGQVRRSVAADVADVDVDQLSARRWALDLLARGGDERGAWDLGRRTADELGPDAPLERALLRALSDELAGVAPDVDAITAALADASDRVDVWRLDALDVVTRALLARDDIPGAADALERLQRTTDELASPVLAVPTALRWASLHLAADRPRAALAAVETALAGLTEIGADRHVAEVLLARCELALGRPEAALRRLHPLGASPDGQRAMDAWTLSTRVHLELDELDAAIASLDEVLSRPAAALLRARGSVLPVVAGLLDAVGCGELATAVREAVRTTVPLWQGGPHQPVRDLSATQARHRVLDLLEEARTQLALRRGSMSGRPSPPGLVESELLDQVERTLEEHRVVVLRSPTAGSDEDPATRLAIAVADQAAAVGARVTIVRAGAVPHLSSVAGRIELGLGPRHGTSPRVLVVDGATHLLPALDELLRPLVPDRVRTRVVVTATLGGLPLSAGATLDIGAPPAGSAQPDEATTATLLALLQVAASPLHEDFLRATGVEDPRGWPDAAIADLVAEGLAERRERRDGTFVASLPGAGGYPADHAHALELHTRAAVRICDLGATPGPADVDALDPHDEQLHTALERTVAERDPRALAVLAGLGRHAWHRGRTRELQRLTPGLLELLPLGTDHEVALGGSWLVMADEVAPSSTSDRVAALVRSRLDRPVGDDADHLTRGRLANVLLAIANVRCDHGNAVTWADAAIAEARAAGVPQQLGTALTNAALAHLHVGDTERARELLDECAALGPRAGNAVAFDGVRRATMALMEGDLDAAATHASEVLAGGHGDLPVLRVEAEQTLAWIALERGDTTAARSHAHAAQEAYRDGGMTDRTLGAERLLAWADLDDRDVDAATRRVTPMRRWASQHAPSAAIAVHVLLAAVAVARGDRMAAASDLREAERLQDATQLALHHPERRRRDEVAAALARHQVDDDVSA